MALSLRAEARGALPATLSRPSDLGSHSRGLGKQPLLSNEKDARGSHKKPGELLIALSLRAEARGLFLQLNRGPATRTRTQGPSKRNETPYSTEKKPLKE